MTSLDNKSPRLVRSDEKFALSHILSKHANRCRKCKSNSTTSREDMHSISRAPRSGIRTQSNSKTECQSQSPNILTTTTSDTATDTSLDSLDGNPIQTYCPYHNSLFGARGAQTASSSADPMQRYLDAPVSEHVIALFDNLRIGTSLSAGCTCGSVPQDTVEDLTRTAIRLLNTRPELRQNIASIEHTAQP